MGRESLPKFPDCTVEQLERACDAFSVVEAKKYFATPVKN